MSSNAITSLQHFAEVGNVAKLKKAIEAHPEQIDIPNFYGWTPMNAAAEHGHVEVVELLVRMGSNAVDIPTSGGWTPMLAASCTSAPMIETLVRFGSNAIDTPDKYGQTPLCVASHNMRADCVRMLRILGADPTRLSFPKNKELEELSRPFEEEIEEVRFRVYFSHSLVQRLLIKIDSRLFDGATKRF